MTVQTDRHSTTISFALDASVKLKEKTLKPPGMDAGGPNSTTTMRNQVYRTQAPKKLITLTSSTFTAAYDPQVYPEIVAMMGKNQLISVTFPDGAVLAFYGWIDKFEPNENQEGEQPTAQVTIEPSNMDGTGAEAAPTVGTAAAGTTTTTAA